MFPTGSRQHLGTMKCPKCDKPEFGYFYNDERGNSAFTPARVHEHDEGSPKYKDIKYAESLLPKPPPPPSPPPRPPESPEQELARLRRENRDLIGSLDALKHATARAEAGMKAVIEGLQAKQKATEQRAEMAESHFQGFQAMADGMVRDARAAHEKARREENRGIAVFLRDLLPSIGEECDWSLDRDRLREQTQTLIDTLEKT